MNGPRTAYVEVNEVKVLGTGRGADWWTLYRSRAERVGRVKIVRTVLTGDIVRVACDDRDEAQWLAKHMVNHGGLPRTAVKVGKP
ncbi:hypothetical protein BBK14_24315 [Parafrankia soli]|uniref:Uncharacterized protein n=1 Tax=Parafrankia soli TaxID=2599596 RepID=A0A1S1PPX0_9ACTN|nr:hypothetical protein [Parafrankia soli]OHV23249.1 hypothetical protein BBK14_24315 [Parafrankia soli]